MVKSKEKFKDLFKKQKGSSNLLDLGKRWQTQGGEKGKRFPFLKNSPQQTLPQNDFQEERLETETGTLRTGNR